jgi:nitroreductase
MNSAFEILSSRKSHNKLIEPAPTEEQVHAMMKVALRAPDHALLRPWRFQIFSGRGLRKLGEYFERASVAATPSLDQDKRNKIAGKPLRAPMVVVVSVKLVEHKKVPEIEQLLSGGASAQNLIMAAHFLGIGAIWRTGSLCFNPHLKVELGMSENESIIGFIYLGQEQGDKRTAKPVDESEHVTWHKG